MSLTVTTAEIARLARVMTWKWAAVELFYGGAWPPCGPRPRTACAASWCRATPLGKKLAHMAGSLAEGMLLA